MNTEFQNIPSEENPPTAKAMINTFRAFGYDLNMAIADIIDNSISAHSANIWVDLNWNGADSTITIHDDGFGMSLDELRNAMKPGSKDPNDTRELDDLGRFGLGLKTASFSQCKRLTVVSKKAGYTQQKRCWDLDYVNQVQSWSMLDFVSDEQHLIRTEKSISGTTVIWEKLDRLVGDVKTNDQLAKKAFFGQIAELERHLSLVFHRYIEKRKISIFLNGNELEPWDPFMKEYEGGQFVATEELQNGKVSVKCYLLPHLSKLPQGERREARVDDWYALQGFYVYRNNRLLLHGGWLGMLSKNEHHKNARILVDISNELDHEWQIDIKKATATPPVQLKKDLKRLATLTRTKAGEIYRFRGKQLQLRDTGNQLPFQSLWKAKKGREDGLSYYINDDHSLIKAFLSQDSISKSDFKRVLKVIGETTPVEAIIQYHSEDPECHELREMDSEPSPEHIDFAKKIFSELKQQGFARERAVQQILNIEPFQSYPQLEEYLK
jgi:hypothetical protein